MADSLISGDLHCVVVTPEKAVLDGPADSVVLPMYDGELGVLPGRAPLIGRLGFGELRLTYRHQTRRFFIDGGFVQVRDNDVTLLTPRALRPEEIRPDVVREALQAALAPAETAEEQEARLTEQDRARAQLRVAEG
jgi:F-type H+-transporting ATPase subunit epsilon